MAININKKYILSTILLYAVAPAIMNLPNLVLMVLGIIGISYNTFGNFNPFLFSLIAPFYLLLISIIISTKKQSRYPILYVVPSSIVMISGNVFDVTIENFLGNGTDSIGNLLLNYRAIFGILVVTIGLYIYQTILLFKRKGR